MNVEVVLLKIIQQKSRLLSEMLIKFMYCIIRYNSDARTRVAGSE